MCISPVLSTEKNKLSTQIHNYKSLYIKYLD